MKEGQPGEKGHFGRRNRISVLGAGHDTSLGSGAPSRRGGKRPRALDSVSIIHLRGLKSTCDVCIFSHNRTQATQGFGPSTRASVSPTMRRIRVLLIEDNRLLREGITAMIKEQTDMRVIASTGNGDALLKVKRLKPDVILLDLGLRGHSSLRLVKMVRKDIPDAKVIIMDLVPVQAELVEFVKAGVSGFILKDATLEDFIGTIRSVAEGAKVLPPPMTDSLFSQIVQHVARIGKKNLLRSVRMTKREREVVEQIADGLSNKEIAQRLNIAVDTVKSHVHNILEKLALHTRLEIASYAHREKASSTRDSYQSDGLMSPR